MRAELLDVGRGFPTVDADRPTEFMAILEILKGPNPEVDLKNMAFQCGA